MAMEIQVDGRTVTAFLEGEIDHHNAPGMRDQIDEYAIRLRPEKLVLDFGKVSFMDSSGIGLVMGRYRLVHLFGCQVYILNLSGHAYKVMRLAGLDKIAKLHRKKEVKENEKTTSAQ